MDDPKDTPLRRAEQSAKRALERLGSAIDKKVLGRTSAEFGVDYTGELASRIERLIESSLKADAAGKPAIAPNRFKVGLTYEEASKLTTQQIDSLTQDLRAAAHEFIHNRRYQTEGPIHLDVVSDLFATSTGIKVDFDRISASSAANPSAPHKQPGGSDSSAKVSGATRTNRRDPAIDTGGQSSFETGKQRITLMTKDGREYQLNLVRGGAPVYIGRAAGNAITLDDPSISRVHSSIALRSDGQTVISDLESANGTFVNGRVVNTGEAQKLELGDEIRVGDIVLSFKFPVFSEE